MTAVDVVVVGGGIQGLVILRELVEARYSCILVTNAPLGVGQTLHSHGLLNSGTGLVTGMLQKELQVTLPYLRRLGITFYGDDRSFLLAPDAMVEQLAPAWESNRYHPELINGSGLPLAVETSARAYRVRGLNVDKRALVDALARGLERFVLRGEVVAANARMEVRATATQESVSLRPRAVVVSAGCGTKRLLHDVFGVKDTALDRISYLKSHMICLRGPSDVLPYVGSVVSPEFIVVGHPTGHRAGWEDRLVTWYVTPTEPDAVPAFDAPDYAVAEVDRRAVTAGVEALVRLFPGLRDARRSHRSHRVRRLQAKLRRRADEARM